MPRRSPNQDKATAAIASRSRPLEAHGPSAFENLSKRVGQVGHDRTKLVPNVDMATSRLGLKVTVPLSEAISHTIQWNKLAHNL